MAAAEACASLASYRIDFIDEYNARCGLLRFLEHITHTAGTDTDEHLYKVRTGNAVERHTGFTGHRFGKQCFAGTGIADHQDTLRNPGTHPLELFGILQVINDLLHLLLLFIASCNVCKAYLGIRLEMCTAGAEFKCSGIRSRTAGHPVHHPDTEQHNEHKRNHRNQCIQEQIGLIRVHNADIGPGKVLQQFPDHLICSRYRSGKGFGFFPFLVLPVHRNDISTD